MEKINDCPLSRFQNHEHLMFHTEIESVVSNVDVKALGIEAEHSNYQMLLANEQEAAGYFKGSSMTTALDAARAKRNKTIDGMESCLEGNQHHYDANVKEASARIFTFWLSQKDIYSTVDKTRNGGITTLISGLKTTFAKDLKTAQMEGWLSALETDHQACIDLGNDRYEDENSKTSLRMKPLRVKVDEAYDTLKTKINALIVVNGANQYSALVSQINIRTKTFSDNYSIRNANRKKKDTDTTTEETK
ncbi:MAG: hypothetical protein RIS29_3103 [Bacteroidota bacterium]|jgi:hypothetical protein